MAIQTTYSENIRTGVAGHIPDMTQADIISRTVEASAGLGFGIGVVQGTLDKAVRAIASSGDVAADFVGVTVLDRSVAAGTDKYAQYDSAAILKKGPILVVASVAVVAGDAVALTAAGAWAKVAGTDGIVVPNARWDTSAGIGEIAQIFIN